MEVKKKGKAAIPKFISIDDILRKTPQGVFIGDRKLKSEETQALKLDAEYFENSILWQLMKRDVHYIAYLQATNKAKTQDDINYANAMYKNLEVLAEFIKNCRTL